MKWIGLIVILFGFIFFVSLTAFEGRLPLVQFVDNETVVTMPMRVILPPGTTFVKGTGTDGARFVDVHSEASKYMGISKYLSLAKLGALALCALGAVGFVFERWREKIKQVLGPES